MSSKEDIHRNQDYIMNIIHHYTYIIHHSSSFYMNIIHAAMDHGHIGNQDYMIHNHGPCNRSITVAPGRRCRHLSRANR